MDFNRRAFKDKDRKLKKINGFFSPQSHAFWDLLLHWQNDHMAPGHLVEIGVWKGKSSSVLASLKRDEEQLHMIDPGLKEEKVSRTIVKVGGCLPPNLFFYQLSSFNIDSHRDLRSVMGEVRFFHIDGEHSGHMIYSDMAVAQNLLSEEGVLVVDDFFNPMYPQITEALFRYLDRNPYAFRLFMVGFNKAYLSRPAAFYDYHRFCDERVFDGMQERDVDITLARSTHAADATIFSMIDYTAKHGRQRGPDWEPENLQVVSKRRA